MKFKRISAAVLCFSFILGSITTGFSAETAEEKTETEAAEEIALSDSALTAETAFVEIEGVESETDIETDEIVNADLSISGSGTSSDPYVASNEDTFMLILDFPDAYWELSNDIVLTSEWRYESLKFSGNLNGNGYTISGIVMTNESSTSSYSSGGFFYENSGTIKNLNLEGTATYTSGHHNDAFFVSKNYGTIENCSAKGTMKLIMDGSKTCGSAQSGGFCYHSNSNGIIQNCYSKIAFTYAQINSSSDLISKYLTDSYIKGFIGSNSGGKVRYCYSASYLTNSSGDYTFNGFSSSSSNNNNIINNYYDKSLNGVSESNGGEGKSTTAMKMQATYTYWDFDDIWAIDSSENINEGYPYLQSEKLTSGSSSSSDTTTTTTTEATTETTTEADVVINDNANVYVSVPSSATVDSEFTVSVYLRNAEKFSGCELYLQYDNEAVEVVSASAGSAFTSNGISFSQLNTAKTDNTIYANLAMAEDLDLNGEILTVTFKALASGEAVFTLPEFSFYSLVNGGDGEYLSLTRSDAVLNISNYIQGDVNSSGKADYVDAILILRYAAGNYTLTSSQISIADMNNDGKATYVDAILILRANAA